MSHYKPGTLDDVAYNARKRAKQRRITESNSEPSGYRSKDYFEQLGEMQQKIADLDDALGGLSDRLSTLEGTMSSAKSMAETALAAVSFLSAPGAVILRSTTESIDGWVLAGSIKTQIDGSEQTFYLFEKADTQ
nr:MAG TPA: hypothetical protein [Caudoviricetes sp.]